MSALIHNPDNAPLCVAYGAGVDSTAMLIALKNHGLTPAIITFADTGGEKPSTMAYLTTIGRWLETIGFPPITRCAYTPRASVGYTTLEGNCVANETLPSLAFGMKSCSAKWKQAPQDAVICGVTRGPNARAPHPLWIQCQQRGIRPIKLIGYDAGVADIRRSKNLKKQDARFTYDYPLQTLGWTRRDCVQAIIDAGLPVPDKSSCFFCPAMKIRELWSLLAETPELFERAMHLEYTALTGKHSRYDAVEFGASWEEMIRRPGRFPSTSTTVGLGRSHSWNHFAHRHGLVTTDGTIRRDPQLYRAMAAKYSDDDNAYSGRSCV